MTECRALIVSLLVLAGSVAVVGQQPSSLLIRNGRLVDGTGGPSRTADVRIHGDAIVEVGPSLAPKAGERVIDAAGRIVAPGFIDMHSHADGGLDEAPDAVTQLRQGITTALVGQDGGGDLPVAGLAERVDRVKPAINLATSVGHGTVRRLVMGADFKRAATPAEIETMKALVDRAMKDGAVGLSSGLEYDPGFYATTDELVALATAIKPYGGFYSSHVRDEENEYVAAWKEAIDVGRRAGVAVEISHMKLASKPVWGHAKEGLALLDAARREGLTVMGDWYPYPYWQSAMYVLIPDRDFGNVEKWRVGLDEIGGPANVRITDYRADPSWNGKTLSELASAETTDPPALIVRMVKAAGPDIGIIGTSMDEADMRAILAHPQVLICSDGQLSGRHPRGYGAFPRVLARYVREQQVISLEEAVAKMTSRSAAMLGLSDRGVIATGKKADVVIFDAATIADRGTPQEPAQPPVGVDTVIVNGQIVLERGEATSARPGRVLRRGARYR
jgi:N-acyl-D-amino-acid deacylase